MGFEDLLNKLSKQNDLAKEYAKNLKRVGDFAGGAMKMVGDAYNVVNHPMQTVKDITDPNKFVSNVTNAITTAKNTKKAFEGGVSAVGQGLGYLDNAMTANPLKVPLTSKTGGEIYSDAKTGLSGSYTLLDYNLQKENIEKGRSKQPGYTGPKTMEELDAQYKPRFNQVVNQGKESEKIAQISKKGYEAANKNETILSPQNLYNIFIDNASSIINPMNVNPEGTKNLKKMVGYNPGNTGASDYDVFRNNLTETGASLAGAVGMGGALLEEGMEKVGLSKERKLEDRMAENSVLVDRGKRVAKNNDFFRTYDYNTFDPETLKYMDPKEKNAFLNQINHPDIDLHAATQRAKTMREKEVSVDELQKKINSGEMTMDEANKTLDAIEASQTLGEVGSQIINDPLNAIDLVTGGNMIRSKIAGKFASKTGKIDDIAKLSKLPPVGIDEYDPKLATKIDTPDTLDLPTKEVPKIEPSAQPELKKTKKILEKEYKDSINAQDTVNKAFETKKITLEKYVEASEYLQTTKNKALQELQDVHGVRPEHILKDADTAIKETLQDVKKINPGITNQDAVKEVMTHNRILKNEEIVKRSDDIVNKFMANEGLDPDPIMKNSILNKESVQYVPSKLKINPKDGSLQADTYNPIMPQPTTLHFTNSMQRLLYEFSVPYNKAIGEGMGWKDWTTYKESMKEIDKVVIMPLSKAIYGDAPTIQQINKLKSNLGAMKSAIDKELTLMGNMPNREINVGQIEKINDMVNDLIKGNVDDGSINFRATDKQEFYIPADREERTIISKLRDLADIEVENLKNAHGLTEQEAMSLYSNRPVEGFSNKLQTQGLSDGIIIAVNEGKLSPGEAKIIDKIATISHEKMHVAIAHLYDNGVGEVLEGKLSAFEKALPIKAKKQFEKLAELLDSSSTKDFLDELTAYTRQYRKLQEHPRGREVINKYAITEYIDSNPELKKELFKWDDMIQKQEEVWMLERANIIRNSKKLKPGEIPTRKIDLNSYNDNSSNVDAKLFDEVNRQDRMKQLLGEEQMYEDGRPVVYRGEDDIYNPRIDTDADDAMPGPGHYTSSNYDQASQYTGIGGYKGFSSLEDVNSPELGRIQNQVENASMEGRNPQFYQEAVELEKPLYWDERPKSDILEAFEKTKDERLIDFKQYLESDPYYVKTGNIGDMMGALPNFANEFGIERADMWDVFKKEILDPNGYDGMVSVATDTTNGYEFVNFNLHQVKRRTGKDKYGFNQYTNIEKRNASKNQKP